MNFNPATRSALMRGASTVAVACFVQLAVATGAFAQEAEDPTSENPTTEVDEIVVTGSRIGTGFSTPTPVTATTAEQLDQIAPNNLADGLSQLPVFSGGGATGSPTTSASGGTNGQNLLNLRGLGSQRNLILLDGRRLPATNSSGSIDINMLPQSLVSRVDVVTGGASAAYGSDAVAGVVNFILDTHFEGLKGEFRSGISGHDDMASQGGSLSYGRSFAGGRGHAILSGEYFKQDGLRADELTGRDWFDYAAGRIPNPVAGARPRFLVVPDLRSSVATNGGLISTGPLRGTEFLPGGATRQLTYGSIVGSTFMGGGDGARTNIGFMPEQDRKNFFGHVEYALTDNITVFAEGIYGEAHTNQGHATNSNYAAGTGFTIFADNAFLPADVRQRMAAANLTQFAMGRYNLDFPLVEIESTVDIKRFATGANGELPGNWTWDAYYTYGETNQEHRQNNLTIYRKLFAAVDAVVDPASGNIVCRSTLSGYDAGCIPLNLFGLGSPSQEAIDNVIGDSIKWLTIKQQVAALNFSGDLGERLQFGAGPIGVATGIEYRKESADQTADAISQMTNDFTGVRGFPASQQGRPGGYALFNPLPLSGEYDVKEVYAEIAIPLLRDLPLAQSLELNGAIRYAEYSLSGGATTWKYGFNYQVVDDLRLRFTESRDIRGPNIQELFNAATQASNNQIYFGVSTPALVITSGNPDLEPEEADTTTYGAVYRPSWLPGFQASVDYYKIGISGAIGNIPDIVARCVEGNALACSLITVTPSNTLIIRSSVVNLSLVESSGYDFEFAYSRPLFDGDLSLRLLANHLTDDTTSVPGGSTVNSLNSAGSPNWRATLFANYSRDNWSVFVQQRYIDDALLDPAEVEGIDTTNNTLPAMNYTTIGGTWAFEIGGHEQELFFNISNLFDKDPPVGPANPTSTNSTPVPLAYDRMGRYFTAGIRFKW
jgi:outer membrane receptor protein involved in Fe transport